MPTNPRPDAASVDELIQRVIELDARYQELYGQYEYEAAVDAASEAFRLLRQLPYERVPTLSAEVGNAAARLVGLYIGDLLRPEEAVAPAAEAVEFCRSLPDAGPRSIVGPLGNLHAVLFFLGRYADGVGPATELVALARQVTPDELPVQPVLLARTLSDLCTMHSALGQHAETVRCGTEAIERLAPLAAADETLRSVLATTYSYLVNALVDVGDEKRAAQRCDGYLDACRAALAVDPDHALLLATALHTASERYLAVGRGPDALEASADSLARWRALVEPSPGKDDRSIAIVLYNFAEIRAGLGTDLAAAESAAHEAVTLYRYLAEQPLHDSVAGILVNAELLLERIRASRGTADGAATGAQPE